MSSATTREFATSPDCVKPTFSLGPFCRTDAPHDRRGTGRRLRDSHWVTWTTNGRDLLAEWTELSRAVGHELPVLCVRGITDEPITYTLPERAVPRRLRPGLKWLAARLRGLSTPKGVILLRDLFRTDAEGRGLRLLFAAVRQQLAREAGRAPMPMFPPTSRSTLAFELHADLWAPELLLNVYVRPAQDRSGQSLLLSVVELKLALERSAVPIEVKREVQSCLASSGAEFRFERLRQLLYAPDNPWHRRLESELRRRRWAFWFDRGEGYLLHDRRWLHGREAIRVRSSSRRFFRLVFNNRDLTKPSSA